jgi:hypothetical protein
MHFIGIEARDDAHPHKGKHFVDEKEERDQYGCARKKGKFTHSCC